MDVPRHRATRRRLIRRITYGGVLLATVPLITVGLSRLEPAAPEVERSAVWTDTVKRGPMTREVRGLGTLVPEEILWIPAITDGRVGRILVRPGARVEPATVLLVLRNPELDQAALDAEYQVKAAEAKYADLKVQLESQRVTQEAGVAKIQSEYQLAQLKADRDEVLAKEGLLPDLQLKLSLSAAAELSNRRRLEEKRLTIQSDSVEAQLAVQQAEVNKLRALARLKRSQVDSLRVCAGATGVLQELPVEVGQRLVAGTILAKVAQPQRLKAALKIPETQAKDVQIGQKALIDTRNGVVSGLVSRIDPAVREGTVTVDVKLQDELPRGARPDLSVDGTIELEHLENIVYVGRPAFGQPGTSVGLFKLAADGRTAARVPVKLGRSSVSTIEIVEGLRPGDRIILSDMSAWDKHDRIRLN